MLIVPLHRAPTRERFPWVTLLLILANVFVFFFLQLGDGRVREQALGYYAQHDLARLEFPAYRAWLAERRDGARRGAQFEQFVEAGNTLMAVQALQSDAPFLADLQAGKAEVSGQAKDVADWRARRGEFDRLWNGMFTERWELRFSEFDPRRMFGAMFLHGGIGHLLGNMLFLAFLGLLVEGALGPGLFAAVYLLGGLGSALLSLAWRWGDAGAALGASGAIASLMGAYCVLWGTRKVRFFWWFFVVFDYVKAPALVLLPFWLGWEVINLIWNRGAHVGFDAHAGGIIVGALLALAVRALHWERRDYLDEDVVADAEADARAALEKAREHIGRLEIGAARALLEPLAQRAPDDLALRIALYRCARYEPRMPRLGEAARAALLPVPPNAAAAREQKAVYDDYVKTGTARLPLSAAQTIALAQRWPSIGAGAAAGDLLAALAERLPATPGLAAAGLGVARDLRARGETAAAKKLLERIAAACPPGIEIDKARLLLADIG